MSYGLCFMEPNAMTEEPYTTITLSDGLKITLTASQIHELREKLECLTILDAPSWTKPNEPHEQS